MPDPDAFGSPKTLDISLSVNELQWNVTLKAQLEAAAADLQHLQQACSRLAPAGVLQHLIADGVKSGIEAAPERKVVPSFLPISSIIPR